MRCEKHIETNDGDFCYKCEELTLKEKKEKYESIICHNSLQRVTGDKEIGTIPIGTQEG
jgi:hypothetical protein